MSRRNNITVFNDDGIRVLENIPDGSIDLIVADPPYGLKKDYGNDSDHMEMIEYISWMESWVKMAKTKLKRTGLLYVFQSWQRSPEIFSMCKKHFLMINEIIWDRRVPSMGGTTRKFSSVHDNIGVFAVGKDYYFNLDPVRIPYDDATKKARSRSIFVGAKWLEVGYNPKDVWSISRLHAIHSERRNHPTQKPRELIDRIILSSSPEEGLVVDPFAGTGTSAEACLVNNRLCITAEINEAYYAQILERLDQIPEYNSVAIDEKLILSEGAVRKATISDAAVLRCLSSCPKSSIEIAEELNVSRTEVAKVIFGLKVRGKVSSVGKARGTKYYIGELDVQTNFAESVQKSLFELTSNAQDDAPVGCIAETDS